MTKDEYAFMNDRFNEILERVERTETRLCRFMSAQGLDPLTGQYTNKPAKQLAALRHHIRTSRAN